MVEAEVTFKADLEKLLKQEGHMPEDKFLVVSRKGKRLTVIAGNCACCAPGLAGLSVIFAATSAARLILRPCSPRLHLRPEARRLRPHQARTAAPIRHRGCDRTHENRRPPRPLLPQGPCRRRRERRPHRSRLQPAPHPRLAEGLVVPHTDSAHTSLHDPVTTQISLLTDDEIALPPALVATVHARKCRLHLG